MSDIDHDAEFEKAFEGFGEDNHPATSSAVPSDDLAKDDKTADDANEDQKQDEQPTQAPNDGQATSPGTDAPKTEEDAKPTEAPAAPPAPEEPKPLTATEVTSIINNIRTEERNSAKELETTTNDVLEAYYPDGLSDTLVDTTGRELKTPQDVVEASNGEMSIEEATQWLLNEEFKLRKANEEIRQQATKIAENTINFKRDSVAAIQKYEPLFKWQPNLQEKAFKLLMKNVRADMQKGVILSAPDVMELYDTYLEPYQQAYEFSQNKPATNPTPAPAAAPTPTADDRLDVGGDGGASEVDDPNDFAQQVKKELAKGM